MGNDLRIEKRQEQVSLFMADGTVLKATVFLAQYAHSHSGEQTLLDLLLEEDPFLPAKAENGNFHLVRKGMISHIRCQVELDPLLEYTIRQVKVCFPGGNSLAGQIKIDLPPNFARLTEYINDGNEFFPFFQDEQSYLINRSLVRDLVLQD